MTRDIQTEENRGRGGPMIILRYWFITFCVLAVLAAAFLGFGALSGWSGPSVESCEQIAWQTKPCEELDRERMQDTLRDLEKELKK